MHASHSLISSSLAILALAAACTRSAPSPAGATSTEITEADLAHRLGLIAHDSMMGRESGSEGDYKTAEYVATEFRRLGLQPAGENGTYFQTVPFHRLAPDDASRIEVGTASLVLGTDFMPVPSLAAPRPIDGTRAVYGGPATDQARWISEEDAAGKLVVFDLPQDGGRRPPVSAGALAANPRFARAAGVAIAQLELMAGEQRARYREGIIVLDTVRGIRSPPPLVISRRAAAILLGGETATLTPGATGPVLRGRAALALTRVPFAARNVVAVLPGSDPALRGQYVALTAHNDHVGFDHTPVDHDSLRAFNRVVRPMGADSRVATATPEQQDRVRQILDSLRRVHAPRLDSIRNGADDDGSGTVSILEIAEKLARADERPRRSILFVSHTGEEAGLFGSRWYTDHATVPLDSVVGEIDQDMVGRGTASDLPEGGPTYLEVIGARRLSSQFGDLLESANAKQPVPFVFNYAYDAPNHPLQYYCRADHYSYARYGIPSVAFSRGEHLDYHQVTDEAQYISYPDLARVSRMVYDAAMLVANTTQRPRLDQPKPADPHGPCRQ
jgi:hypothetical protein